VVKRKNSSFRQPIAAKTGEPAGQLKINNPKQIP